MASLAAAIGSIRENVRLAVLSALGIAVAAMAIVLLVSIGTGVEKDMTKQIDELGVGLLIVVPGKVGMQTFNPNLAGKSYLSDQAEAAVRQVEGVVRTAKFTFAGGGIRSGASEAYPIIIATTPSWFQMQNADLVEGRFFEGASALEPVCVLGSVASADLFGEESAVGKTVTINGSDYRVTGVVKTQSADNSPFSMFGFSNVAYIPIDYLRAKEPDSQIDRIIVQVANNREPKGLVQEVSGALGRYLTDQQFSVLTQEDLLKLVYQIVGILSAVVAGYRAAGWRARDHGSDALERGWPDRRDRRAEGCRREEEPGVRAVPP